MIEKSISRILKYGTIASTYLLVGSVLLQIFARYLLPSTPAWTEESSRLFFVYAIAFASGLALKEAYYVHMEVFFDRFPQWAKRVLSVLTPIMLFLLLLCVAVYSVSFVVLGISERSPSMKFSMSYVFFSMVIMAVSMSYFAFKDLLNSIREAAQ